MDFGTIIIIVIGIIILWGVIQGAQGQKKWKKTIAAQFATAGLIKTPEKKAYVEKLITALFQQETNINHQLYDIDWGHQWQYVQNVMDLK